MSNLRRFVSVVAASALVLVGLVAVPASAAGPAAPAGLRAEALDDGTVHFEWDAAQGASAYRIEWSTDDTFPTGSMTKAVNTYALDHVTQTQPSLGAGGDIYWRVASFGSGVTLSTLGDASATSLVPADGTAAPTLRSPGAGEVIEYPAPAVFAWDMVDGAVAYQLEYTSDTLGAGASIETNTVVGTQFVPAQPLARVGDGGNALTWKWRVRAQHYNGTTTASANYGPWSQERDFQITWNSAPQGLLPANEIVSIHSDLEFKWNAVAGAAKYRITLGDAIENSGSAPTIFPATTVDVYTTTYIPTAQVSDKTSYWQVTPLDYAGNPGTPSAVHQYKKKWSVQDGPSAPSDPGLTQPQGITGTADAAGVPPQMYLSDFEVAWEPVPRATFYQVEVRDGASHVWYCRTASTSATIVRAYFNGLDNSGNGEVLKGAGDCLTLSDNVAIYAGGNYSWRVRAVDYTGSATTNFQQSASSAGSLPSGTLVSSWSVERDFAIKLEDRAVPEQVEVDLDLEQFVVDNTDSVKGQPAPLMTWNRSGKPVTEGWESAPGYEVTLYKNADRTSEIATFRTPSTKLRLNGVLQDNTTGNPYFAAVRPIVPLPNWTSPVVTAIGGVANYSADSFEWQKKSNELSGLLITPQTDGSVRLSWDPQSVTGLLDGGSRGYQVRIYNGETLQGITKKTEFPFFMAQEPKASNDGQFPSSSTDLPLPPGNNYSFEVAPLDANGNPGRSTRSAKFGVGIATPVVSEPAVVQGGTVSLTWSTVPGASKYSVEHRQVGSTSSTVLSGLSQTAVALTALGKGNYEWRVRAHDPSDRVLNVSPYSAWQPISVGDADVALDLRDAAALPLNNRVVSWGSSVRGATRFQVQLADDAQFSTGVKSYETVATSFAFPDLMTSGKEYHWRVRALAEPQGSSNTLRVLATSSSDSFTVRTVPDKVTRPRLTVAGTGLTASWTLLTGAKTGTDQPISYVVAYRKKSADSDWSEASEAQTSPSASSFTVSGLAKGIVYEFRVAARNSEGTGPWSDVAELATATAPTAAPTLTATAKLKELSLRVGSVSATGGSAITGYRLSYKHISATTWTTKVVPYSSTMSITGLKSLYTYQVSIAAINAVGTGPATEIRLKTLGLSTAPRSVKAARADRSAKVTWSAPSTSNGTVTGYAIQKRLGTSGTWLAAGSAQATARSFTATGLVNGKKYQVRVAAKTSVGTGAYSSAVSVTPAGKPLTPARPKAVSSSKGVITVTWSKAVTNGSSIKSYTVQYSNNGSTWYTAAKTGASTYKLVTSKGTRGKKVYFRVIATNYMGSSAPSSSISVLRR